MVRSYTDEAVDPAVVDRALAHATRAPSAGSTRGWGFLVLDTPEDVGRFWAATSDDVDAPDRWLAGMVRAPVVVLPCSSRAAYVERYAAPDKRRAGAQHGIEGSPWSVPYWHMDAAMASLLVLQTLVDEGLGGCFFGVPPDRVEAVTTAFGIPAEFTPVGAITIGHPAPGGAAGSRTRRPRRDLDEVVHRGRWGRHGSADGAG